MGYFLFMVFCWTMILIVGVIAFSIFREYREWNGGVCPHTGGSWMYWNEDETGGRVYRSGGCKLTVYWSFIDNYVDQ